MNIIKRIPWRNTTALWLCLGFAALYMFYGIRMIDTLAYDYDGLFFHTDTAEVAEDITAFKTRNHGDTSKHPLFVILVNPFALLLQLVFDAPATVVIINTLISTLAVWLAFLFFRATGLPLYQSVMWTIVTGSSASSLLFTSIPERHALAALSMTFLFFIGAKFPAESGRFIWAGIFSIGVTITNLVQCVILFFCSLFNSNGNSLKSIPKIVRKTFRFGIITVAITTVLSLIQNWIWPEARLFFLPDGFTEQQAFVFVPRTWTEFVDKLAYLTAHMFVYGIIAPEPAITAEEQLCPLSFTPGAFETYTTIGRIAVVTWIATAATALCCLALKPRRWLWLQISAVLCLVFNIGMHMIYGDNFFLYTVNWTFPLIALIATATVAANKNLSGRIFFNIMLTFLAISTISSNTAFMHDFTNYFLHGDSRKWQKWQWEQWDRSREIKEFLNKENIHTIYAADNQKWLMYALDKQVSVVNVPSEKSPALKQSAELVHDGYAFLRDIANVTDFISNTMGSYKTTSFQNFSVFHDIVPPLDDLVSRSASIKSVSASCSSDTAKHIIDLNIDTAWTAQNNLPDSIDWLELQFSEETLVSCVKIFSRDGRYPLKWRVEVRKNDSDPWQAVTRDAGRDGYFWSGPRIFWGGRQFRLEARFIPAFVKSLRLVFMPNDEGRLPSISELRIYGPSDPLPSEIATLPLLIEELGTRKINSLYSERWVANAVYQATNGKIKTLLEPYVFEHKRARPQPRITTRPYPVYFSEDTAILVRAANADATRSCLADRGYNMRESIIGPWILFSFERKQWTDSWNGYSGMCWSSVSCFLAGPNAAAKKTASDLTHKALKEKSESERHKLLERALEFYPDHQEAIQHLLEMNTSSTDTLKERLSFLRNPGIDVPVKFGRRIRLLGITIENKTIQPGDDLTIRYYWRLKPSDKEHFPWVTFVHFQQDGKTIFQGDHHLGGSYSYEELLLTTPEEIVMESVTCRIPDDAPAGSYNIVMGCYNRSTKKRIKPKHPPSISSRRRSIILPDTFTVTTEETQR